MPSSEFGIFALYSACCGYGFAPYMTKPYAVYLWSYGFKRLPIPPPQHWPFCSYGKSNATVGCDTFRSWLPGLNATIEYNYMIFLYVLFAARIGNRRTVDLNHGLTPVGKQLSQGMAAAVQCFVHWPLCYPPYMIILHPDAFHPFRSGCLYSDPARVLPIHSQSASFLQAYA